MIVLGALDPDRYRRIVLDREPVAIDPAALARVEAARARLLAHLDKGGRAYGVNTGVGALAGTALEPDAQLAFQRALLARGAGTGPPLAPEVVRGALLLRLAGFLDGAAGVSPALCAFLADRLNDGWSPLVPSQGISSAGEVVALSHLFGTLAGEGEVLEDGVPVPAADALARRGVAPFAPGAKEGIALVNGAPLAPALTASLVSRARGVLDHATLAGALAVAASGGSLRPHSTRIAALKGDPGQAEVAAALVAWQAGAEDWSDRPQPPVSTRVLPQVLGAALDLVDHARAQVERELHAVTDSPVLLDALDDEPAGLYPSGNFHAQALAFALDTLKLAFAQVANVAEKGLHRLLDHRFSGLPDQLAAEPGTQTGLVFVHKAAIEHAAACRLLATPASAQSVDGSSGQEDVQAFTFVAGDQLGAILGRCELIVAAWLIAGAQARALRDLPLPPRLEAAVTAIGLEPVRAERSLSADLERVAALTRTGALLA